MNESRMSVLMRLFGTLAIALALTSCTAGGHFRPIASPKQSFVEAIGGSGNGQSQWFHLDAGTYRIELKSDRNSTLHDVALMRHAISAPGPDGSYTSATAPVVAQVVGVGSDVEMLPAGDYVLIVAAMDSEGWTLTIARVS